MKGLLLKDWYQIKKYFRMYFILTAIFMAAACFPSNDRYLFFLFYPCLLGAMIPINLVSYDERSGWERYSATLPYTRAQLVSVKYIIGILSLLAYLAAMGILQVVRGLLLDSPLWEILPLLFLGMFMLSTVSVSICLPCAFRLGVEKGKVLYFIMIGIFVGGLVFFSGWLADKGTAVADGTAENLLRMTQSGLLLPVLFLACCGLYALSWRLSIAFYEKREV